MTAQLIPDFDAAVQAWLDDTGPAHFCLAGVEFELVYDGHYRVLCEGVEVAWNDNPRDFAQVGHFLLNTDDTTVSWLEAAQ